MSDVSWSTPEELVDRWLDGKILTGVDGGLRRAVAKVLNDRRVELTLLKHLHLAARAWRDAETDASDTVASTAMMAALQELERVKR